MSMVLSAVQAKEKVLTIEWDGEKCDIAYRPAMVTPDLLTQVQEAADKANMDVIGVMLEPLLVWWDVLDDDGQRIPTDAATIARVPLGFSTAIMEATQKAMLPPDKKGSGAG